MHNRIITIAVCVDIKNIKSFPQDVNSFYASLKPNRANTMFNHQQKALIFVFVLFGITVTALTLFKAVSVVGLFVLSLVISLRSVEVLQKAPVCVQSSFLAELVPCISKIQKMITGAGEHRSNRKQEKCDLKQQMDLTVEYIHRDFILAWLNKVSHNEPLSFDYKKVLNGMKTAAVDKISACNKTNLLEKYVDLYYSHFQDLKICQNKLRMQPKYRLKRDKTRDIRKFQTVEDVFCYEDFFHAAAFDPEKECLYIQNVLKLCLRTVLSAEQYSCVPACNLVIEIISHPLIRLVDLIADPYWLHYCIIKLTSDEDIISLDKLSPSTENRNNSAALDNSRANIDTYDVSVSANDARVDFVIHDSFDESLSERPAPVGSDNPDDARSYVSIDNQLY